MRFLAVSALIFATTSYGYDCNSDCRGQGYSYPCGVDGWPPHTKFCHGDLPNDPVCMSDKAASCSLWDGAVDYFSGKVKPLMQARFNHDTWQSAVNAGSEGDWTMSCIAGGVASFGALGTMVAAPWGGVIAGAAGTFVAGRICEQAHVW